MVTTQEVLRSKRIIGVFERIRKPPTTLSDLFGFGIGGTAHLPVGGRQFNYDIFNMTRDIAEGRRPGDVSATTAPQNVGIVQGTFPRAAETIPLLDEKLHNFRRVGGPVDELDVRGEAYITKQEAFQVSKFSNLIEFQTAAMLRGLYVFIQDGDTLSHDFTGTGTQIDFQIPANNKDQLNGIIAATWATTSTDIPQQLYNLNEQSQEDTGLPIQHAVMERTSWGYLINNDFVIAQGGSANVVFEVLSRDAKGNFTAILRAIPWLQIHVVGHGLNVGTAKTYTKLIEVDHVAFFPDPDRSWVEYGDGSEVVTEGPNGPRSEQFGLYPYAYPTHDPSGWNMTSIHNGIPHLYVPGAIYYADVTP